MLKKTNVLLKCVKLLQQAALIQTSSKAFYNLSVRVKKKKDNQFSNILQISL